MNRIKSPTQMPAYEAGEMLTEQSHARTTDMDFIIDQFTKTGILKHVDQYAGTYGEFVSGDVYELAQTAIAEANTMFQSIPPKLREEFPGGTQDFLEYISNPENKPAMEEQGLDTSHFPELICNPARTTPVSAENAPQELTEALSAPSETE